MSKWRKKPVVIEAKQIDSPDYLPAIARWCDGIVIDPAATAYMDGNRVLAIDTLEGRMYAEPGDWIIKGVAGEFYPCKPDIFAATYEPLPEGGESDG